MEIPKNIAGLDSRRIRALFKAFVDKKSELSWENGLPTITPRQITTNLIREDLGLQQHEAERVHEELIKEGYIDQDEVTPTRQGMALAQHVDRPKISRDEAESILGQVLNWAERVNEVAEARVKVQTIHLFGSLCSGADWVDDIDLFVEFTTMDLGDDLQPEDMAKEDELCEELSAISDRLSPSSEFERMLMSDVEMQQVFPRAN